MSAGDRFYFSPDAGFLVERGDRYYTQYGYVVSCNAHIRMMPCESVPENYADWSDAKRRKVRKELSAAIKAQEAKERAMVKRRDALALRAKRKLNDDEYKAVYDKGFVDGRY